MPRNAMPQTGALMVAVWAIAFALAGCTGDAGPAGGDGTPGEGGIACWDGNSNGTCDAATEDADGDGSCTVSDCVGTGAACWDVDANGACDAAAEDSNGDGACDVRDCAGVSAGTLSGTVISSLTGDPLADVAIGLNPAIAGVDLTTNATGGYTAVLPVGNYAVTFELDNYESLNVGAGVAAAVTTTLDVELVPNGGVIVDAGPDQDVAPGAAVTLPGTVIVLDGSTVTSTTWTQTTGTTATLSGETTETLSATLADMAAYRDELMGHVRDLNRFGVQPITPLALEEAEATEFKLTVVTSSGTYTDTVHVLADLPYAVNGGLHSVPTNVPVMLTAPAGATYNWTLSAGTLDSATIRNPSFTPTAAGAITVTETVSGETFQVFAGTWEGNISGINATDGLPDSAACTGCHNGTTAPDKFTGWRATGHAGIFSSNISTSDHYGTGCFACHTVGYDPDADNGGLDDASDYDDFEASTLLHDTGPEIWSEVVSMFPETAQRANIQCENCHGPHNGTTLHLNSDFDDERISLDSSLCGACHGEPLRHARFQQWELSGHANYELAESRGTSRSCAPCHSANGFIYSVSTSLDTFPIQAPGTCTTDADCPAYMSCLATSSGGLECRPGADEVHSTTCVACHDPHTQGLTSGEPNTASVRVEGNTPMLGAGYRGVGLGRGALCVTCHNSRYGAVATLTGGRAPHGGTQGDVVLGFNANFVPDGMRSPHSYLPDSCTNCHMEQTDPPADLSYRLGGTNHTFEASFDICNNCHGEFDGEGLAASFDAQLEAMEEHIADGVMAHLNTLTFWVGEAVNPLDDESSTAGFSLDTSSNPITAIEVISGHGRLEFELHLTSPVSITYPAGTVSASQFGVQVRNMYVSSGGARLYADDSNAMRAGWNLLFLQNDGSHGSHNPGFYNAIISATMARTFP